MDSTDIIKGEIVYMKAKKYIIIATSVLVGLLLLAYVALGIYSVKPGMNGFTVTNGMIRLVVTGKDYVKVGENKYLYREGSLHKIILNEYDSYRLLEVWQPEYDHLSEVNESGLLKAGIVSKDGQEFKGKGNGVWGGLIDAYSVFYIPYEE